MVGVDISASTIIRDEPKTEFTFERNGKINIEKYYCHYFYFSFRKNLENLNVTILTNHAASISLQYYDSSMVIEKEIGPHQDYFISLHDFCE